jgi:hypothetical protein
VYIPGGREGEEGRGIGKRVTEGGGKGRRGREEEGTEGGEKEEEGEGEGTEGGKKREGEWRGGRGRRGGKKRERMEGGRRGGLWSIVYVYVAGKGDNGSVIPMQLSMLDVLSCTTTCLRRSQIVGLNVSSHETSTITVMVAT